LVAPEYRGIVMETPRIRLGELLVRAGLITPEQLEEALSEQRRVGKRLGSLLVDSGLVSETQVTQILSQQLSVPWVSLHHIDFSRDLLDLVPVDLVERYCLIPIYIRRVRGLGDALYVAMDDPTNAQALAEVAERSRLHVRAMIAPPSDIRSAIYSYYGIGAPPAPPAPLAPPVALAPVASPPDQEIPDHELDDVPTGIHSRRDLFPTTGAASASRPPQPPPAPAPVPPPTSSPRAAELPPLPPPPISSPRAAEPPPPPVSERRPSAPAPRSAPPPRSDPRSAPPPRSDPRSASPPSSRSSREFSSDARSGERARRAPSKPGARRMIALTLLDGTTIQVPSKGAEAETELPADSAGASGAGADLTARDVIAALRATARGADASDILGENARWEAMLAALLSVLLKKHLIADWEFIEEFKKL